MIPKILYKTGKWEKIDLINKKLKKLPNFKYFK